MTKDILEEMHKLAEKHDYSKELKLKNHEITEAGHYAKTGTYDFIHLRDFFQKMNLNNPEI